MRTQIKTTLHNYKLNLDILHLKELSELQTCTDDGKLFHKETVCGKKENWYAVVRAAGLYKLVVLKVLKLKGRGERL